MEKVNFGFPKKSPPETASRYELRRQSILCVGGQQNKQNQLDEIGGKMLPNVMLIYLINFKSNLDDFTNQM